MWRLSRHSAYVILISLHLAILFRVLRLRELSSECPRTLDTGPEIHLCASISKSVVYAPDSESSNMHILLLGIIASRVLNSNLFESRLAGVWVS